MAFDFNADEVFEMAERIERNGAAFYRKAATGASDDESRSFLLDLAAMEDDHLKTFSQMRQSLSRQEQESAVFDPDNENVLYLRAHADGQVFDMKADPSEFLEGGRTMRETLRKAIELEKDSIVFYLGIKEMVPERLGRGHVEDVIKQEMGHIALLSEKLRSEQQEIR